MTARMMHLTMWYAGHDSYESWWAATRRRGGLAPDVIALHDLHRGVEWREYMTAATSHGRSRRDGTRP